MRKQEFLDALRKRLGKLSSQDVEERLGFYAEMIDDRIEEGLDEEAAVAAVGSVDAIVAQLAAELPNEKPVRAQNLPKRTKEPKDPKESKEPKEPRRALKAWSIVLIAVGSPIWLSLLIAAAAVVLALYIVLWAVLISLWAVFVALAACAVAGSLAGIVCAVGGYGYAGCFLEACALVCGGLAILFGYGCNALSKGTVRLTHWLVVGRKHRYTKKESM